MNSDFSLPDWTQALKAAVPHNAEPHSWICEEFNGEEYQIRVLSSAEFEANKPHWWSSSSLRKLPLQEIIDISKNFILYNPELNKESLNQYIKNITYLKNLFNDQVQQEIFEKLNEVKETEQEFKEISNYLQTMTNRVTLKKTGSIWNRLKYFLGYLFRTDYQKEIKQFDNATPSYDSAVQAAINGLRERIHEDVGDFEDKRIALPEVLRDDKIDTLTLRDYKQSLAKIHPDKLPNLSDSEKKSLAETQQRLITIMNLWERIAKMNSPSESPKVSEDAHSGAEERHPLKQEPPSLQQ